MDPLNRLLYIAMQTLFRLLGNLPESAREFWALFAGRMLFALDRKHRRITIDNLSTAFGKEKSKAWIVMTAREVFVNLCRIAFETAWSLNLPENKFSRHFHILGQSHFHKAHAKGKGVLLLGAHFGNWEVQMVIAYMMGIPLHVVYRPLDVDFAERFVQAYRSRFGAVMIPNQRAAMRKIYAALKKGYPVGMLMDQCADFDDGVFADFFNHRAATNTGMAILALKSNAPVVPFFLIRRPHGFQAVFGPELPLIQTGDRTKDIEENTQLYNHVIEAYVRKFPDQWFWVHQRWKNLPFCPWPRTNPRVSNRY
jgi:Kdo2-lipid IVA lauroyltransferase/acyltransferase